MNLLEIYKQYPKSIKLDYDEKSKLTVAHYLDYNFDVPHIIDARGLILDEDGQIVARPYKKFFNYKELADRDIKDKYKQMSEWHDGVKYDITLKVDGALAIMFYYKGKWMVSSGNTLNSQHVKMFNKYLDKKLTAEVLKALEPYQDKTILLEYTSPLSPLVIYYKKEEMILHGVIDTKSGVESSYEEVKELADKIGFPIVKRYDVSSLKDLLQLQKDSKGIEGYVVTFEDGHKLKIKVLDYYQQKYSEEEGGFRVSKMASQSVPKELVQMLYDDDFDDFLAMIESNDEFTPDLVKPIAEIPEMLKSVEMLAISARKEMAELGRKEFALKYKDVDNQYMALGFSKEQQAQNIKSPISKVLIQQIRERFVNALQAHEF